MVVCVWWFGYGCLCVVDVFVDGCFVVFVVGVCGLGGCDVGLVWFG